jgi:hypothetical protein
MKRVFIITALVAMAILLTALIIACQLGISSTARIDTFSTPLELFAQKTTLEEAAKIIGITIPVPDYLPAGFEIQETYVQDRGAMLLISDGPVEKKLVTHTSPARTPLSIIRTNIALSRGDSAEWRSLISSLDSRVGMSVLGRRGGLMASIGLGSLCRPLMNLKKVLSAR